MAEPCQSCHERAAVARGWCHRCYNRLHPGPRARCPGCGRRSRRGGACHACGVPGVPARPAVAGPAQDGPREVVRHGVALALPRDPRADERERARRVEVYRRQLEATGRLDYRAAELYAEGGAA